MDAALASERAQFSVTPEPVPFMNTSTRRTFFIQSAVAAGTLCAVPLVHAQAAVADSDPQAAALGYRSDASKVDKAKYPNYAAGQHCGSCALYQGKAGEASGPCPLFAGKVVSANGWCSAWAKKG